MTAKSRRLAKLWQENNKCHWCNQETIYYAPPKGGKMPPNAATIDHLRSRYHPLRREPSKAGEPPRTVLSCFYCNNKRSSEETSAMPIEERRARSGFEQSVYKLLKYPRVNQHNDNKKDVYYIIHENKVIFENLSKQDATQKLYELNLKLNQLII